MTFDNTTGAFDILGGNNTAENTLQKIAEKRMSISAEELAALAARAVLDQRAIAKTQVGHLSDLNGVLPTATSLTVAFLAAAGVGAAIGIDYQIFGGASETMPTATLPFVGEVNPLALGALVFAAGLGLSDQYRKILLPALFAASAGASFLIADNPSFRAGFSNSLEAAFTTQSDTNRATVQGLESQISSLQGTIAQNNETLTTGGNNGRHMLADGATGNDQQGNELDARIKQDQDRLQELNADLGREQAALELAERKDWTGLAGRFLAAGYLGAWLISSQLLVAAMTQRAAQFVRNRKEETRARRRMKTFLNEIESDDPQRSRAAIESAVKTILTRFAPVLVNAPDNPDKPEAPKQAGFTAHFEGDQFKKIVSMATRQVFVTIHGKESVAPEGNRAEDAAPNPAV